MPVPEAHVAGLVVGALLQAVWPWRLVPDSGGTRTLARAAGGALAGTGLLVAGWAVRAVGDQDVERPAALVSTGPYAYSRNPMYVAWTALYLGVAFLFDAAWLLAALPAVALATHRTVRREERSLARAFGDEYRAYRRDVPRYLSLGGLRGRPRHG